MPSSLNNWAMLSTGEKNEGATFLSLNGAKCVSVILSYSSYSVTDLTKLPGKFLPGYQFELQVDDQPSSVRPGTVQAFVFIAKVQPHLCQILGQFQASTDCFVSLLWRS